jgi:hypothetical protein
LGITADPDPMGGSKMLRKLASALAVGLLCTVSVAVAGPVQATNTGNEGCTPGYWKNHMSNWEEYSPSTVVGGVFDFSASSSAVAAYADTTFAEALRLKGGSGLDGATQILLRAAVAATLNAAHEGLGYPLRREGADGIFAMVDEALASGDRQTMLELASYLDSLNNLGCPL